MLCGSAIGAACTSGRRCCPHACFGWPAEARSTYRNQPHPDGRLQTKRRFSCSSSGMRERLYRRASAAPPLDLSTKRRSQQPAPLTETAGGGGGRSRGWGGAPPHGGGGSGWRRSSGDEDDDDMDAGAVNPFHSFVVGLQSRAQTEPHFTTRLLALALLDLAAVLLANYAARGPRFSAELDVVISQAVVSVMNTVLLGVLLPPRHAQAVRVFAAQDGGLRAGLAVLPPHVFASSPTPSAFGLPHRVVSLLMFGAEFGAVGFLCGSVGTAAARRLVSASSLRSESASSQHQSAPDVGAKWLVFMAVNGNIRHQLLRCCERTLSSLAPPGIMQSSAEALLYAASHVIGARQWLAFAALSQSEC